MKQTRRIHTINRNASEVDWAGFAIAELMRTGEWKKYNPRPSRRPIQSWEARNVSDRLQHAIRMLKIAFPGLDELN